MFYSLCVKGCCIKNFLANSAVNAVEKSIRRYKNSTVFNEMYILNNGVKLYLKNFIFEKGEA